MAIVVLLGRLVPARTAPSLPRDLSRHAKTLVEQYRLASNVFVLALRRASPLAGTPVTALPLDADLRLVTVSDAGGAPRLDGALAPGDRVVVRGTPEAAAASPIPRPGGAEIPAKGRGKARQPMSGVAEAVIPPRSAPHRRMVFPGMVPPRRPRGDGGPRGGEDSAGEITPPPCDYVLIQGRLGRDRPPALRDAPACCWWTSPQTG